MISALGLDTAFRSDASAGVVVRAEGDTLWVVDIVEVKPPPGGRLVPTETLRQILDQARTHNCDRLICDIHYVDLVHEVASGLYVREAPGGANGKLEVYTATRTELHEGRIRVPARFKRLIAQLKEVIARPQPGGGLSIKSPRRAGSHGDLVSAFTLAVWDVAQRVRHDDDDDTVVGGGGTARMSRRSAGRHRERLVRY